MSYKIVYEEGRKVYLKDGEEVTKEVWMGENKINGILESRRFNTISTSWPMYSDALGVNPDQIDEARAESVRMGVPTDFNKDGQAILESRGHRKKYAEANGMYDRDGGYGDAQPNHAGSGTGKDNSIFKSKMGV
jgi:hypothetical protein